MNLKSAALVDQVCRAYTRTTDTRWNEISAALIRHLHAFVAEVKLTPEEWLAGVEFLTQTGKACIGPRQEFILLSDALGVSSAVDDLNGSGAHGATESALLGPFYAAGSREIACGDDLSLQGGGDRVWIYGQVRDTNGNPIDGATLDIWHASPNQLYAVQDPQQPTMNCRGKLTADAEGRYQVRTTMPVSYPVPTDGPVGKLLEKAGRHPMRPAHVHFIVSAPGYRSVTTQIFTADDQYIDSDAVFGVKPSLLARYTRNTRGDIDAEWLLEWNFVLVPADTPENQN
jgi:hydroxyquinol 1,2-dioxygenase